MDYFVKLLRNYVYLHFLNSTTYRLDVFIAGESLVQFTADDFELPVEVVGRLEIDVGHL